MPIKSDNLNDYLRMACEVSSAHEITPPYGMEFIERLDEVFHKELFKANIDLNLIAGSLAVNSYWLFLSAVRIALSGHPAGVFPIIRTALESAYYCFLISRNSELADAWLNRHADDDGRKKCRRGFGLANADVKKILSQDFPEMAEFIGEQYERLIDWGAHPNPQSILVHLNIDDATDGELSFAGLYSPGTREVSDSLLMCSGGAIAIIFLIASSLKGHPLSSKNNAKIASLMGDWLLMEHELSLEALNEIDD